MRVAWWAFQKSPFRKEKHRLQMRRRAPIGHHPGHCCFKWNTSPTDPTQGGEPAGENARMRFIRGEKLALVRVLVVSPLLFGGPIIATTSSSSAPSTCPTTRPRRLPHASPQVRKSFFERSACIPPLPDSSLSFFLTHLSSLRRAQATTRHARSSPPASSHG